VFGTQTCIAMNREHIIIAQHTIGRPLAMEPVACPERLRFEIGKVEIQ
jgi:hypothetical protein